MSQIQQNCKIILASTSFIRKRIMEESGLDFQDLSPDFDEEEGKKQQPHLSTEDLAMFLAKGKATSISNKFKDTLVIGSDQICEFDGKKIDKSKDKNEAINQLELMNGGTHYQNNAVVIMQNGEVIFEKLSKVELKMRKMTKEEISRYVNIDEPWGSAGSYKYESLGKHLFANIKGDYYSILGLNVQEILNFLHEKKFIGL